MALDAFKRKPGPEAREDIIGFVVVDNGVGFNEANMRSFATLDSDHKALKGCRGVGRLLWLKAFDRVTISSVYETAVSQRARRQFAFTPTKGVEFSEDNIATTSPRRTSVRLDGFKNQYRKYVPKTPEAIAESVCEHCLWYFIRPGGAPSIVLLDEGTAYSLQELFDHKMHTSSKTELLTIKGQHFDLIHLRLNTSHIGDHALVLCADKRVVASERLSKLVGGIQQLKDDTGAFQYFCYISSPYLDEHVRSDRTAFDLPETAEGLFAESEISIEDINAKVTDSVQNFLAKEIAANKAILLDRIEDFVSNRAPRYRPILKRIQSAPLAIDPDIADRDLDVALHKELAEVEQELLSEGHDILAPKQGEDQKQYQVRVAAYMSKANDIKMSDLANYVSHRKVILDLFREALRKDPVTGKYVREDLIHSLIMPMRCTSNEVMPDGCNLWLLDERLAFHHYLASDKPLSSYPITESAATKEPDLCALNVFDNPCLVADSKNPPLASLVVIELKRPMRDDARSGETDDPIEQALGYLERIRDGRVRTCDGRPILNADRIPGYCYIVCDLTSSILARCKLHDLTRMTDGDGYFGFKSQYNAYVEVISFDRLVTSAAQRNRAFFDKLGLPNN